MPIKSLAGTDGSPIQTQPHKIVGESLQQTNMRPFTPFNEGRVKTSEAVAPSF
jgi:hypothetical protein